jgi:Ca2+-binding RTX toxin-like protein
MPERALGRVGRVVPPEGVYTALVSQAGWAKSAALRAPCPPTQRVAEGDLLMRRRALLVLASLGLLGVLLLGGGVALADTIDGTSGPDDLVGTDKDDVIHASGGKDYISGLAAPDVLYGGAGNDTVVGRDGNDRIYGNTGSDMLFGEEGNDTINSAGDRQSDVVKCGQGDADRAYVDKIDRVKDNCENVFLLVRSEEPTS